MLNILWSVEAKIIILTISYFIGFFIPEKYDFVQFSYINSSWSTFLVEGTHDFYSASFLLDIIGYILFQLKHINLGSSLATGPWLFLTIN